jgi:N-acetylneuraminic acid mutarotase
MSDALYACNVSSNSWFVPKTQGTPPRGLAAYGMCHDESSTIYIFGGIYESGR